MSGHSKWSTIKRKKAANDAKRGSTFTRLAREIALAAREAGGDAETNFGLRLAVERARAANMPKDNIERAIKRGTGEDKDATAFERILYEGYAPHGVAVMMEVVTDNRNRTVAELRHTLTKAGGTMAEAGAVAWQFRRAAYFSIPARGVDREKLFEMAVEAGADDVVFGEDSIEVFAPVESFKAINDVLHAAGLKAEEAGLRMLPNNTVDLPSDQTVQVMRVVETLEDLDDMQLVFSTLHVSDEAVALLETA
ncbi:MAG: putative transcriptional regulatory protein [Anaerolineales bacterium]|jgi:YebC/PmpR family DNA-binding regulatory protein|nr:putative transcriptional regulatory protein [Anaerolineales bacterium]